MTLTKEWLLRTIAELEEERDSMPGAVNEDAAMALTAMKLALTSIEAEPVAYVDPFAFNNFSVYRAGETDNKRMGREWMWANPDAGLIPVYTSPPAPVSVPDGVSWEDVPQEITEDDMALASAWAHGFNQCRAATLQSFGNSEQLELVTTAYKLPFDQWLSQQTGTIDVECGCVMTEVFFHWLRVAYEAGNSPVIPNGWVTCSERMPESNKYVLVCNGVWVGMGLYNDGEQFEDCERWQDEHGEFIDLLHHPVSHWMPLPEAPQQEGE